MTNGFTHWLESLGRFPPGLVVLCFTLVVAQLLLQASRWFTLFPRRHGIGWRQAVGIFVSSHLVNVFFPARAGDAVRILAFKKNRRAPEGEMGAAAATGVVLADKVIDGLSLFLCLVVTGAAASLCAAKAGELPKPGPVVLTLAGTALVALIALVLKNREWLSRLLREVARGLSSLKSPFRLFTALFAGTGAWLAEAGVLLLLCSAQGTPVPLAGALFALLVLNIGIAIPLTVANLGTFEAAMAFALTREAVPLASAIAVAAVHHALQLLTPLCLMAPVWLSKLLRSRFARSFRNWRRA